MPNNIPPLEYPDRFEVRYVSANGGIRWEHDWLNVSTVCAGDYVGLEEIDDGVWNIYQKLHDYNGGSNGTSMTQILSRERSIISRVSFGTAGR